jgi:hypothetical protein
MSRATTEAWYNSERIDRLKLVAAYLFLNGIVGLLYGARLMWEGWHGGLASLSELLLALVLLSVPVVIWLYSALLLWNARRTGAYWVIALTVLSVIRWLDHPWNIVGLIIDLIPAILVAMSWSALKSGDWPAQGGKDGPASA